VTRAIRIGISSCLLGEPVRYDGGHKRDDGLCNALGPHVEWVPVCPEAGAGLGIPREPIELWGEPDAPRVFGKNSGADHTARLLAFIGPALDRLAALDLAGYVLKSKSPSCGLRIDVKPARAGTAGLFARALTARFPRRPVEEESRLTDPTAREHFLERARAYAARERNERKR
jgi:uncharacterized protein YbbK (DUF523 family)